MAKYLHPDVLDGGHLVIKNSATQMVLLKAYAVGDSYATVSGNTIASAAVVTGDFSISTVNVNDRRITGPSNKSATASAGSGAAPNLHVAFIDATRVLWVTDETTDQVITSGNPVDFPNALTLDSPQPV